MLLGLFRPLSPAEHEQARARIARRAMMTEFDRGIVQNARQAIQRSRELLEVTKHHVRQPSSSA
jgi:hypothetical protein